MKRFVYSLIALVALVVVGDWAVGSWLRHGFEQTHYDEIGRQNYICDSVNADIIVLGSSRALHHYVPSIITDSTGLSCYNCGFENEGIVFHYALLRQLQQRYQPKLIIYELTYDYDVQYLTWRPANLKHLHTMAALSCRDSILCSVDPWERVSLLSSIYPFNSQVFTTWASRKPTIYDSPQVDNGYIPQYNLIKLEPGWAYRPMKHSEAVDSLKVGYLHKLIAENASRLMVVVSPRYLSQEDDIFGLVEQMCQEHGVPFICMVSDPVITHDITQWDDDCHLNHQGAVAFTRQLAPLIKQQLKHNTK